MGVVSRRWVWLVGVVVRRNILHSRFFADIYFRKFLLVAKTYFTKKIGCHAFFA